MQSHEKPSGEEPASRVIKKKFAFNLPGGIKGEVGLNFSLPRNSPTETAVITEKEQQALTAYNRFLYANAVAIVHWAGGGYEEDLDLKTNVDIREPIRTIRESKALRPAIIHETAIMLLKAPNSHFDPFHPEFVEDIVAPEVFDKLAQAAEHVRIETPPQTAES